MRTYIITAKIQTRDMTPRKMRDLMNSYLVYWFHYEDSAQVLGVTKKKLKKESL